MTTAILASIGLKAERIQHVTADEAFALMQTSFDRFMKLIASLDADEWTRPTACTAWNVHDMVAHQAGGYASGTGYREMLRQYTSRPKPGQLMEDAINELQVGERTATSPADLIAELERVGPIAVRKWAFQFRLIKPIGFPHPIAGFKSLRYLMWIIHSRDTWMHRLDICRATGRPFEQTREHDGRVNELVVLDVAELLKKKLHGRAITLILGGIAGGTWQIGTGTPEASIEMDVLDFNIYASGRYNHSEGLARAKFSGDSALAALAFKNINVLY